jgi:hypothetical protein
MGNQCKNTNFTLITHKLKRDEEFFFNAFVFIASIRWF